MTLSNPAGKTVQSIKLGSVAATGGLFQTLTVNHPASGHWHLALKTAKGSQAGAYALIEHGQSASLTASLTITKQTLKAVTATFRQHGRGISGKLTATIELPSGRHLRVVLKALKGDRGTYRATLKRALGTSTLPLQAVITASGDGQKLTAAVSQSHACG